MRGRRCRERGEVQILIEPQIVDDRREISRFGNQGFFLKRTGENGLLVSVVPGIFLLLQVKIVEMGLVRGIPGDLNSTPFDYGVVRVALTDTNIADIAAVIAI